MRVTAKGISLDVPPGLTNTSNDVFRSDEKEEVSVSFSGPEDGASASAWIAETKAKFSDYFGPAFRVEQEGETVLGGAPAAYMRYELADQKGIRRGHTVAGVFAGSWIRFDYVSSKSWPAIAARFGVLQLDLDLASSATTRAAPAGFRRFNAREFAFNLPKNFQEPTAFSFESVDGSIRISLWILASLSLPPSTAELLARVSGTAFEVMKEREETLNGSTSAIWFSRKTVYEPVQVEVGCIAVTTLAPTAGDSARFIEIQAIAREDRRTDLGLLIAAFANGTHRA